MTKKKQTAPSVVENPHGAAAPPRQSMRGSRLTGEALIVGMAPIGAGFTEPEPEPELEPEASAPPASELVENPHELAAPPRESMAGAVLEPEQPAPLVSSAADTLPPSSEPGLVVENPHELAAPPRESMAGAVLEPEQSTTPAPERASELPPAVRSLPRRPRLRATFSYDHQDQVVAELTLMSEKRELIHRLTLSPKPGSTIAKIFEALTAVVATAARDAGAFGELKD